MPANLPQDAKDKWFEVTQTKNPQEKIRLMQEFLALVPKHKGTEKLCAQVKTQISELKGEIEKKRQVRKGTAPSYFIEKAGAAQIVILGLTNVGRSSFLRAITKAEPEVGDYPFTTRNPVPGMLLFKDIQFQMIEAPAIIEGASSGKGDGFKIMSLVRNADGLVVMVDLTNEPTEQYLSVARELEQSRIMVTEPKGDVEIQRRGAGSDIQFIWEGEFQGCTTEDVIGILKEYKIRSAIVRVKGLVTMEIVEDSVFGNAVYRPTFVVANKADVELDSTIVWNLKQVANPLEVIPISAHASNYLAELIGSKLFELLQVRRIYTKEPGKEHSRIPIVSKGPITVKGMARMIHSDFYKKFKYAKIWGSSAKFPAERVGLERELYAGDVVELHA